MKGVRTMPCTTKNYNKKPLGHPVRGFLLLPLIGQSPNEKILAATLCWLNAFCFSFSISGHK